MAYMRLADLVRIADEEGFPLEKLLKPSWSMAIAERRRLGIPTLDETLAAAKAAEKKDSAT